MNELTTKELQGFCSLLRAMHPADRAEMRRFAEMTILSRRVKLRPITAEQWACLTEWDKFSLIAYAWLMLKRNRARRFIRSLFGMDRTDQEIKVVRLEVNDTELLRSTDPANDRRPE